MIDTNWSSIPARAERIPLDQVFKFKRVKSEVAPRVDQMKQHYECAGCSKDVGAAIPATHPLKCDCGLSMQSENGEVRIWREQDVMAGAA